MKLKVVALLGVAAFLCVHAPAQDAGKYLPQTSAVAGQAALTKNVCIQLSDHEGRIGDLPVDIHEPGEKALALYFKRKKVIDAISAKLTAAGFVVVSMDPAPPALNPKDSLKKQKSKFAKWQNDFLLSAFSNTPPDPKHCIANGDRGPVFLVLTFTPGVSYADGGADVNLTPNGDGSTHVFINGTGGVGPWTLNVTNYYPQQKGLPSWKKQPDRLGYLQAHTYFNAKTAPIDNVGSVVNLAEQFVAAYHSGSMVVSR